MARRPLYCHRWTPKDFINLGEALVTPLVRAFGYEPVWFPEPPPDNVANPGECLLALGSVIDGGYLPRLLEANLRPVVWGCGSWGDERLTPEMVNECRITAVRGPKTLQEIGKPNTLTAMGDSALLMPVFYPMRPVALSRCWYMPHCLNVAKARRNWRKTGATAFLSPKLPVQGYWLNITFALAMSDFMLTNSLHGAILSHCYGTPWALCLTPEEKLDKPAKWLDWLEFLGLPSRLQPVANATQAHHWWKEYGERASTDVKILGQLGRAFPYPCLNLATKDRISRCLR